MTETTYYTDAEKRLAVIISNTYYAAPLATDWLAAARAAREYIAAERREADAEVIERALRSEVDAHHPTADALIAACSTHIAAALDDANLGGHWEEGAEAYERAMKAGLPRRVEFVGEGHDHQVTYYGWVPADPDAELVERLARAIATADLPEAAARDALAKLRETHTIEPKPQAIDGRAES